MKSPMHAAISSPLFRSILLAATLAAALSIAGCKSTPPASSAPDAASNQSSPQSPAASPAPASSPNSTTPPQQAANQPYAQPSAPVQPPPPLIAPVGTRVVLRTTQALSASHNDVGDAFSGELAQPIVSHGTTLFARGTRVAGTVVASKHRGRFKGSGDLAIEVNSIGGIHVQTTEFEQELKGKGKRTGGLIGGGAGLGAIIGGLAGGGKGAVIGGLAGAGAGTAGAAYSGNKDVVIPSESLVTVTLTAPMTVQRTPAR